MLENGLRCGRALSHFRSLLSLVSLAPASRQQLQRQPAAAQPPALAQCETVALRLCSAQGPGSFAITDALM